MQMTAGPEKERRRYPRFPLAMGVQFYHGPTQREFPGQTVDISKGGVLMHVPATVPVRVGQPIRMNMAGIPHPELGDLHRNPIDATIVRVDRSSFVATSHLAVGLRFAQA